MHDHLRRGLTFFTLMKIWFIKELDVNQITSQVSHCYITLCWALWLFGLLSMTWLNLKAPAESGVLWVDQTPRGMAGAVWGFRVECTTTQSSQFLTFPTVLADCLHFLSWHSLLCGNGVRMQSSRIHKTELCIERFWVCTDLCRVCSTRACRDFQGDILCQNIYLGVCLAFRPPEWIGKKNKKNNL